VISPLLSPRIEYRCWKQRNRVNSGDVCTLVSITSAACQSQIVGYGFAQMLAGDDVIDLETEVEVFFKNPAILAPIFGPGANERLLR
jgi:hypothetical protein